MTISDILMISATIIAPFVAVTVQKHLEDWRAKGNRKLGIFKALMATRAATLSFDHVQALNMIDLEFSDNNPKEKRVKTLWKEYLDHLGSLPSEPEKQKEALPLWNANNNNYLAELLEAMGQCVGYDFDKVYIKKGIYSPLGHANDEHEIRAIRLYLLQVLEGKRRFPMHAILDPSDNAGAEFVDKYRKSLIDVLEGKAGLKVTLQDSSREQRVTE